jgi:hypothetical protein
MSKNSSTDAELSRKINKALSSKPDFSETFTNRMATLAHIISRTLAAPAEHDPDMNYGSSQRIVIWLSQSCRPVHPRSQDSVYQVVEYVSSKGPFFTFVTLHLSHSESTGTDGTPSGPQRYWIRLADKDVPAGVRALCKKITSIMQSFGYSLLEGSTLERVADGHLTEMDQRPATVFEVLFSEFY